MSPRRDQKTPSRQCVGNLAAGSQLALGAHPKLGYVSFMCVKRWLIAQASLIAVILSISLSGFGMAQTHGATASDAPIMDHSTHANMDHAAHGMNPADHGPAHQGHANCPMMACCYAGGFPSPSVPAMADAIMCQHTLSTQPNFAKAEPENTEKPPKHA